MKQGRIDNTERDKLIMQLRGQGLTEEGISQEMLKKFNYKVSASTCGNVVRRLRGQWVTHPIMEMGRMGTESYLEGKELQSLIQ